MGAATDMLIRLFDLDKSGSLRESGIGGTRMRVLRLLAMESDAAPHGSWYDSWE